MKPLIFCSFLILAIGCREKGATAEAVAAPKVDSAMVPGNEKTNEVPHKAFYRVRDCLVTGKFEASIQGLFMVPEGKELPNAEFGAARDYFTGNYLIFKDKQRQIADTLLLEDPDPNTDMKIADVTDSVQFTSRLLQLNWSGDSDYPASNFIEYTGDSLRYLFGIEGGVNALKRKDARTLVGLHSDRDEIVYTFQNDYQFTVNLDDYSVIYTAPPVQRIDYDTEALGNIKAYKRVANGDSVVYTIKKGTRLSVDTFYRTTNTVRLTTPDSVVLFINAKNLKGKIQENTAG